MSKRDFVFGASAGILVGILSLPITANLRLEETARIAIVISLPALTLLGLFIASFLSKFVSVFSQLAKFIVIGALNTSIDFAVLNGLIFITQIASGFGYSFFKGISFVVAVINSYFWNKHWTFSKEDENFQIKGREFAEFLTVSVIGFAINVGTASFIVNFWGSGWGLSPTLLANVGAAVATLISLTWNFLGYKFIVFKR